MDLPQFIASPLRSEWISDCGLRYYVRRSLWWPGAVELASVHNSGREGWGMWQFLRRYSGTVPFYMEQVLNPRLAAYMRRLGWDEYCAAQWDGQPDLSAPHFGSPLLRQRYGHNRHWQARFGRPIGQP